MRDTRKIHFIHDQTGYIELIDSMGNDLTVVNAARVSYSRHKEVLDQSDERLLKYMARHNHFTPFTHIQIQLRIKMPIFILREWRTHQVGLTRNEVSRRYVRTAPEFYYPEFLREAAPEIKQGSTPAEHTDSAAYLQRMQDVYISTEHLYNAMISDGVAPEQARMVLPQSMYTSFVETGSLAAYARIIRLRSSPDAMKEIRDYAELLSPILEEIAPLSTRALLGAGS